MPILLLNLRNVPEDEADEVRTLMAEHGIDCYETRPSMWGISAGGIWLKRPEEAVEAKRLLAEYQRERERRAREAHAQAVREGTVPGFIDLLRAEPLRVVATLAAVILIAALMIVPFLRLGN